MKRVHMVASGLVQGVFFRASVRDEARRLGLTGWARNLPDGSVAVEAQGDPRALDELVAAIRRGPGSSVVEHVEVAEVETDESETTFGIQS